MYYLLWLVSLLKGWNQYFSFEFFFMKKQKFFDFFWVHLFFEFYPTTVLKVYFSCRTTIGNLQVFPLYAKLTVIVLLNNKVWGKKKCTCVCVYYKNYARFRQKSIKSAKSTHPENSKLVRQVHVVQKVPPGSMIEQKNGFCENTIFVKNYLQKKVHLHLWISCKIC